MAMVTGSLFLIMGASLSVQMMDKLGLSRVVFRMAVPTPGSGIPKAQVALSKTLKASPPTFTYPYRI
jgi:hypothetical protein